MNYSMIRFVLGWVLKVEGMLMLLPCFIALIYREPEGKIYLLLAFAAILAGGLISSRRPKNMELYPREGFVAVGLAWLLLSAFGALPFVFTGEIPSYVDAFFEIVSGFTTTGSSILSDVEALSHTTLFWRSFSHWVGGMGVLVFILMMIPSQNGSHMNLMKAESPGPEVSKFVPKVRNTARILYRIYLIMTLIQIVLLLATGMYWFDALCITFGTAGTGGFGVLNSSCGSYTPVQQWIITVFMIAFGVNFSFYYLLKIRRPKDAFKMEEVRYYIIIILLAIGVIAWNISGTGLYHGLEETVRASAFQVGSIITTTGFSTTDFDMWPTLSKTILVGLMVIGACAGSTGGGIKVSRFVICLKSVKQAIYAIAHPRAVRKIRMDGHPVQENIMRSLYGYMVAYFAIFAFSVLAVSVDNFSFETNFTAVAATLNNIGPGLAQVGPTQNFGGFSIFSKLILSFDMLAGRLELFPMLMIFYPKTWKNC